MDRTRWLRQARDNVKKKARIQQVTEEEAAQLDQFVEDARQKVEAIKAAKNRAAESRRILDELQNEMLAHQDEESDKEEVSSDQFVSKADFGSMMASSLRSVVSIYEFNVLLLTISL